MTNFVIIIIYMHGNEFIHMWSQISKWELIIHHAKVYKVARIRIILYLYLNPHPLPFVYLIGLGGSPQPAILCTKHKHRGAQLAVGWSTLIKLNVFLFVVGIVNTTPILALTIPEAKLLRDHAYINSQLGHKLKTSFSLSSKHKIYVYIYCLSILTVLLWSGQQICLFNRPSLYLVLPLMTVFFWHWPDYIVGKQMHHKLLPFSTMCIN